MNDITTITSTITASFLASLVEVVEAFTIVLAVGITRSWRPALHRHRRCASWCWPRWCWCLGRCLTLIPLHLLQFVVGVLLLLFGMRWLRKAVLRAAGIIALHDETAAYAERADA